jgi:hypothetical protein
MWSILASGLYTGSEASVCCWLCIDGTAPVIMLMLMLVRDIITIESGRSGVAPPWPRMLSVLLCIWMGGAVDECSAEQEDHWLSMRCCSAVTCGIVVVASSVSKFLE